MKDAAPFFKKARKFFEGMAKQLVAQGHALDVFACSLDQVGPAPASAAVCNTIELEQHLRQPTCR